MEKELQNYLYTHIPITQAMGIEVEHASLQKVILFAPFANNINHKRTVFGGSLHAAATLACWCLLYLHLKEQYKERVHIVIAKSDIQYLAPIDADFKVECVLPESKPWQTFLNTLHAKGKARIEMDATIYHMQRLCVAYHGTFAALPALDSA